MSTYVLGTVGGTFAEGVVVGRYQQEFKDITFFARVEAVADVSYKEGLLFTTERPRLGVQKDAYSIALAADIVQSMSEEKINHQATLGLAAAVQF